METTLEKPKKLPKLTKKQRGFVEDYVIDENGTQAVIKNYDVKDESVASSISTENLRKPYIAEAIENKRKSLKEALIEAKIDEKKVADTIKELLDATDEKGNKDYTAKDKGLKHTLSIYGIEDQNDKPKSNTTYNFIFSKEIQEQIRISNEIIKAKLISNDSET